MKRMVLMALSIAGLSCPTLGSAQAGPCTQQIAQLEQATRHASPSSDTGPTASQSVNAQLHRQPTPSSIKEAQEQTQAAFDAGLASAKDLDAQGKRAECSDKVAELRRMLGFQ